jgi:uncharacterized membrane protein
MTFQQILHAGFGRRVRMESQATRQPAYDLLGVLALSFLYLTAVLTVPGTPVQALLGLLFVLVLPGYALLAAISGGAVKLALSERLTLSCVLSLATVMFVAMSLNVFRRLDLAGLVCALEATIAAGCLCAYRRRTRIRPDDAGHLVRLRLKSKKRPILRILIDVLVAACVCTTLCLMVGVITSERAPVPTTAFYLLGKGGKAGDYVETARCGSRFPVTLGVINNEQDVKDYSIRMRIGDERPRILARITLDPRETWEEQFEVTIEQCGTVQSVTFDLVEGQSESPYRSIYQRVRTTSGEEWDDTCEEPGV